MNDAPTHHIADALTMYRQTVCRTLPSIMPGTTVQPMWYKDYRRHAKSCDVLLHTPTSYGGRAIARHTGGPGFRFCHVESAVWWNNVKRLMSCGYQEGLGGVARPLSSQVRSKPGHIHVFRAHDDHFAFGDRMHDLDMSDREQHVANVRENIAARLAGDLGEKYGWGNIVLQLLTLLPVARFFLPDDMMSRLAIAASKSAGYGICSQHIARSYAECGVRLMNKPHAMVTPNDIAQSALLDYVGTLVIQPKRKKRK